MTWNSAVMKMTTSRYYFLRPVVFTSVNCSCMSWHDIFNNPVLFISCLFLCRVAICFAIPFELPKLSSAEPSHLTQFCLFWQAEVPQGEQQQRPARLEPGTLHKQSMNFANKHIFPVWVVLYYGSGVSPVEIPQISIWLFAALPSSPPK